MLLFNDAKDTNVPISDLRLLLVHGSVKEAWVNPKVVTSLSRRDAEPNDTRGRLVVDRETPLPKQP
jgi:hypothetical protein